VSVADIANTNYSNVSLTGILLTKSGNTANLSVDGLQFSNANVKITAPGTNNQVLFNSGGNIANTTMTFANSTLTLGGSRVFSALNNNAPYTGVRYSADTTGAILSMGKARGARGNATAVQVGDDVTGLTSFIYTGNGATTLDGVSGWVSSGVILANVTALPTTSGNVPSTSVRIITGNTTTNATSTVVSFDSAKNTTFNGKITATNANITAGANITGDVSIVGNLTVSNGTITGSIATASQTSITTLGNLTSLQVAGNIHGYSNLNLEANIYTSNGSFSTNFGNIYTANGNIVTDYGNMVTNYGDLGTKSGNIFVTVGNIYTANGNIVTDYGNMVTNYGDLGTKSGNIFVTVGDIISSAGNIHIHNGGLTANGDVSIGGALSISSIGVPQNSTDTGTTGQITYGGGYIYICTATNTWMRAALATW
jgi:hypothetical protein